MSKEGIRLIKLVALDLDDTLLDTQLRISRETSAAIRQAVERGVVVTLATGRMYRSARPFAQELGLDVPLITYHGALVKTTFSQEVLYHKPVPLELARKVVRFATERNFDLNLYLADQLFVNQGHHWIEEYSKLAKVSYRPVEDLLAVLSTAPDKIMVIDDEEKIDQLAGELRSLAGENLHITKSKPFFLEITHPGATKGMALDTLVNYLGITPAEVMAVGDSYNDLEMLEYAGIGVAMGNARKEIKDRADFVTASNDEHGVAEAFKRFVL